MNVRDGDEDSGSERGTKVGSDEKAKDDGRRVTLRFQLGHLHVFIPLHIHSTTVICRSAKQRFSSQTREHMVIINISRYIFVFFSQCDLPHWLSLYLKAVRCVFLLMQLRINTTIPYVCFTTSG